MAKDERIRRATLGRNSDALDDARRTWMATQADKLVESNQFPTIALLQSLAGTVRASVLARLEHSLEPARQVWVRRNGPHPDWNDTNTAEEDKVSANDADTLSHTLKSDEEGVDVVRAMEELEQAQRQIKRLVRERKADRAKIRELKTELAEAKEGLRRVTLGIRAKHTVELNKPSTSTRS